MSKKNQMLLNIVLIIISWISIPFLGWKTIKRYSPASVISILVCALDLQIGKRRKWWTFYNNRRSSLKNEIPFLIGPMFVMAFLTLKLSYGNFIKFMLYNAIGGVIFTGPVTDFFSKMKLYKLVRINKFQFFVYFYYKAFLLYAFQYLFEKYKIAKV